MNAVELAGVAYSPGRGFRIAALDLVVPDGAVYGFLGPNGAGKTTTLRLVLGLLRARAGRIEVLGQSMPAEAPAVLARVGYVPEQPHFDSLLTVREILRFQAAFYRDWDWATAERLLLELQLPDERKFGRLSKGQKAKLMMLTVLAQRPELLVLDEPTDGLDPVARRDILVALLDYVADRRATVMISSHLVHELEGICTWVGVMDAGSLVVQMPMDTFRAGIKRLRFAASPPPAGGAEPPFVVLSKSDREPGGASWVVRNWHDDMAEYFAVQGTPLREVIDLGLEDGYVELLRAFRHAASEG
jgi:ABC-2 type transport system ATP-binding protein